MTIRNAEFADGRTFTFDNNIELAKFVIFAIPNIKVPCMRYTAFELTPEVQDLIEINRKIKTRRFAKLLSQIPPVEDFDDDIPF